MASASSRGKSRPQFVIRHHELEGVVDADQDLTALPPARRSARAPGAADLPTFGKQTKKQPNRMGPARSVGPFRSIWSVPCIPENRRNPSIWRNIKASPSLTLATRPVGGSSTTAQCNRSLNRFFLPSTLPTMLWMQPWRGWPIPTAGVSERGEPDHLLSQPTLFACRYQ